MSSEDGITIKCIFGEDLRRFRVAPTCNFKDFVNTVSRLYNKNAITIKYSDEEGDFITLTTDEELQEGFRFAKSLNPPVLRVNISESLNQSQTSSSQNTPQVLSSQNSKIEQQSTPTPLPNPPTPSQSNPQPYVSTHSVPISNDPPSNPHIQTIAVPIKPQPEVAPYAKTISSTEVVYSSAPHHYPSESPEAPKEEKTIQSSNDDEWMKNYLKLFSETASKAEQLSHQMAQSSAEICKRVSQTVEHLANQTAETTNNWANEYASKSQKSGDEILKNHQQDLSSLDSFLANLSDLASSTYQKTSELSQQIAKQSIKISESSSSSEQQQNSNQ